MWKKQRMVTILILAILTMIGGSLGALKANAALLSTQCPVAEGEHFLLPLAEEGWTSFRVYWSLKETYSTGVSNATFTRHDQYVVAKSSKTTNNPFRLTVSGVIHQEADGTKDIFTMSNDSVLLPADTWQFAAKESTRQCTHSTTTSATSRFGISVWATNVIYLYSQAVILNLNT